jgi:hypothetical protein
MFHLLASVQLEFDIHPSRVLLLTPMNTIFYIRMTETYFISSQMFAEQLVPPYSQLFLLNNHVFPQNYDLLHVTARSLTVFTATSTYITISATRALVNWPKAFTEQGLCMDQEPYLNCMTLLFRLVAQCFTSLQIASIAAADNILR